MKKEDAFHLPEAAVPAIPSERLFTFHHIPRKERYALGKELRKKCPREAHAKWKAPAGRPDPVGLVLASGKGRMQELLPLRYGRMSVSPFTYYRGAALPMASDLSFTPNTGLHVQACGDAHLCNFGGFATPERQVIFSINDLDETLPAPWEWDVKRLATSFVTACRDNALGDKVAVEAARRSVRAYREYMRDFSEMAPLELWHYALQADMLLGELEDPDTIRRIEKRIAKEQARNLTEAAFPKIEVRPDGTAVFADQLPVLFHPPDFPAGKIDPFIQGLFDEYRASLPAAYRLLLDRFKICDVAFKVVGVGSVGTRCWIILLMTGDNEPFVLQVKEARHSVLEPYTRPSVFDQQGQRVVNGQRLMQPFSDAFLGWLTAPNGRHFFIRQFRDVKISPQVEIFKKADMFVFAGWCGRALALAHARSGDAALLSGYMGKSDALDQAIGDFAVAYADQNERDYAAFMKAIDKGKIPVVRES